MYGIFGVLTTIVNFLSYYIFYELLNVSNVISNIIAWFLAVSFAYVTNRGMVFGSTTNGKSNILKEMLRFFVSRVFTGVVDLVIMYITVDLLLLHSILMKFLSNIIVIIGNYVLSKFFVFLKENKQDKT